MYMYICGTQLLTTRNTVYMGYNGNWKFTVAFLKGTQLYIPFPRAGHILFIQVNENHSCYYLNITHSLTNTFV